MDEPCNTITTSTVILVFIVIIVIAGMTAWLAEPSSFDNTSWKVFIVTLSSLSIIMTFMFYYAVIELQESQQQLTYAQEITTLTKAVRDIMESMRSYYKTIPRFVASLFPLQRLRRSSRDSELDRTSLSYNIFSVWQCTISNIGCIRNSIGGYVALYMQWASSRMLYEEWNRQKVNFSHQTQCFGDMLFEHAPHERHPEAFSRAAEKLVSSHKFHDIAK